MNTNNSRPITGFYNVLRFFGFNNPAEVFAKMTQGDKIDVLRDYYLKGKDKLSHKLSFQM